MRIIALFWVIGWSWTVTALAAETTAVQGERTLLSRKYTNGLPLVQGPDDANITKVTARLLERQHYLRQPFNDEVSSRFLDRYLNALDGLHIFFTQEDIKQFEQYRTVLDELTLKEGDSAPARVIFSRFLERLNQQYDYVTNLLDKEQFEFKTDEKYLVNRKNAPRPKDLTEAKQLWRDRLRYEYLQEKLGIGRPEEISRIVREQLEQKHSAREVVKAIQEKVSKEKAQDIRKLIEEKSGQSPAAIAQALRAKLEQENAEEIVKLLTKRYSRLLRALNEYEQDDVLQLYLTALSHVYDPHSDYMGHAELENFSIGMKLSLFGIGALLRSEDGFCKIQSLTSGGPAERSKKLKPNDKIIAVAQSNQPPVDVVDMKLSKVVEMIRGPKGTEVRLTVIPADAADPSVRKTISLVRDEIKLEDQEAKAKLIEMPYNRDDSGRTNFIRIGVIDLPSFYSQFELEGRKANGPQKSTTLDVARLIAKLAQEKISGIVLDLRRNGGGSLEEAIRLTGLFIKEGPVVQVKGPDGDPIVEKDPETSVFYDGPLVVLTSRMSASASEILAGALQDYGRALIVGDSSTHGKGTVQSLLQLKPFMRGHMSLMTSNDPGALKITIRKFYRASGASTQLKGVTPDIVLPSVYNHAEIGEAALENPLPWDTIPAADHEKLNRIEPLLPELKQRSEARVSRDPDFQYIREDIDRYKKNVAEKTVSLNEAQRLKEKQDADARLKARKQDLAARPEPPWTVYELTLKHVEQPGLPPPTVKTNSLKTAAGAKSAETNESTRLAHNLAAPGESPEDEIEDPAEDKIQSVDATLEEAKRLLVDLITLSPRTTGFVGAERKKEVPPTRNFTQ